MLTTGYGVAGIIVRDISGLPRALLGLLIGATFDLQAWRCRAVAQPARRT